MEQRNGDYIFTASGAKFYPLDPRPEEVLIEDIAHALSNVCRFTGHVANFYSVAQHSVLVSHCCPLENALQGLLHDASEAYIADLATPVKRDSRFNYYRVAEKAIMNAVYTKFNLPLDEPAPIKLADMALLFAEKRDLMPKELPMWEGEDLIPAYPKTIFALSPESSKYLFMQRFNQLTQEQ